MNEKKTEQQAPLRILELRSENVKRLRAVRLELNGQNMVIVGGKNAQGKTSLLDSVEMLLRGAKAFPAEPVRRGAKKARIVAKLGDLVVEREIRPNRSHTLVVRDATGKRDKPQQILDELCNQIAFDPLAFATYEPAKQDATLRSLVGLDTSDLDQKEAASREARKLANRDLKAAQAVLEDMPARHADTPAEEQTSAAILKELEEAESERADQQQARQALVEYDEATESHRDEGVEIAQQIIELETRLFQLRTRQETVVKVVEKRQTERVELAAAVDALVEPDTDAIRAKLSTLEETNRKVRENTGRKAKQAEVDRLEQEAETLTDEITKAQEEREQRQAAAEYPVDGLSFDPAGGVLLNGLPLDQASQAERLRVSVAIGFALNPGIKVLLVRDGSLLDDDHLKLLGELAAEHEGQLLVERVGDKDPGAVIISDGEQVTK
jgi:energy-coupling factor transporter ATP-binding protein EcfA2